MCKSKINECPYCGSKNIEHMGENDYWNGMEWHCHECDSWFNEETCAHEEYWHQISCLLNGTSEEQPLVLEYPIILPSVDDESCGLSDLEKPSIDKVFQVEGDGTMWYHFEGCDDYPNGFGGERVPVWEDMSELDARDLQEILKSLHHELSHAK